MAFKSTLMAVVALASAGHAFAAEADWAKVDQTLGRSGVLQAAGVHRYGFPRSDLSVSLDGVTLRPAFALGQRPIDSPGAETRHEARIFRDGHEHGRRQITARRV